MGNKRIGKIGNSLDSPCLWALCAMMLGFSFSPHALADDAVVTVLHTFNHATNREEGSRPGGLTLAPDGTLYGTTQEGGLFGAGTVFRMSPSGDLTTLHVFKGSDGLAPFGCLLPGADGAFYGTTNEFSARTTVFRVTPTGDFRTEYVFPHVDDPIAVMVKGTDMRLYSIRGRGGFELSSNRRAASEHSIIQILNVSQGQSCCTKLPDKLSAPSTASAVRADDGIQNALKEENGVALCGENAIDADGSIRGRMHDPASGIAVLSKQDGKLIDNMGYAYSSNAYGRFAIDDQGDFIATTEWGGWNHFGVVRITKAGEASLLYSLDTMPGVKDWAGPESGILRGQDGYFYGFSRGSAAVMLRFKIGGPLEVLRLPTGEDRINANWPFVQAKDGSFFGTGTQKSRDGLIFHLTIAH